MYKNIIFDVYGTMIDVWTDEQDVATWQAITPLCHFYGANLLPEQIKVMFFEGCQKQLTAGQKRYDYPEIDVVKVFYDILDSQGVANKQTAKFLTQAFRVASTRKLQLFDNVLETLAQLKKAGKKLYMHKQVLRKTNSKSLDCQSFSRALPFRPSTEWQSPARNFLILFWKNST